MSDKFQNESKKKTFHLGVCIGMNVPILWVHVYICASSREVQRSAAALNRCPISGGTVSQ